MKNLTSFDVFKCLLCLETINKIGFAVYATNTVKFFWRFSPLTPLIKLRLLTNGNKKNKRKMQLTEQTFCSYL